jgi:hypothetical protein
MLEGNGAGSAGKLVANMASFLSPAAKVTTEQRPIENCNQGSQGHWKDMFVRLFSKALQRAKWQPPR